MPMRSYQCYAQPLLCIGSRTAPVEQDALAAGPAVLRGLAGPAAGLRRPAPTGGVFFRALEDIEPDAWGERVVRRAYAKSRQQDRDLPGARRFFHLGRRRSPCRGAAPVRSSEWGLSACRRHPPAYPGAGRAGQGAARRPGGGRRHGKRGRSSISAGAGHLFGRSTSTSCPGTVVKAKSGSPKTPASSDSRQMFIEGAPYFRLSVLEATAAWGEVT